MSKVFLSHSGADKEWYVNIVYKQLAKAVGEDHVVIDQASFQEGRNTLEEIFYHMDTTDLFVVFLSEHALTAKGVRDELERAEKLTEARRYQICPIIIDPAIRYDDSRIPAWLQKAYNIQYISSQVKAAQVIRQRMIEISYEKHPKLREKNTLFVGRNDFLKKFEERFDDFEQGNPTVLIASGLEGVGRRTFLQRSLFKSNVVKETYPFSSILLREDESIEDCILKLCDLGFFTEPKVQITELTAWDMEKKEQILSQIIKKLQEENNIVIIIDNGCIVNHAGSIAEWFENAVLNEGVREKITLLLACRFRYYAKWRRSEKIYDTALPELDIKERNGLLKRYAEFENIELTTEQMKEVSGLLSGYPEQVFYAVTMIKQSGWKYFHEHSYLMAEFNSKKALTMLGELRKDDEKAEFLALLSQFDYISVSYVLEIVENEQKYLSYIEEFYFKGICEYIGVLKEYIRVNDTIREYFLRSEYDVSREHKDRMRKKVIAFIRDMDGKNEDAYDAQQVLFELKAALQNGMALDDRYIVPSIYLKSMNELYNIGKFKEVIDFADRAVGHSTFMDQRILYEIRYLLCLALAKTRNDRFLEEIHKIDGADHDFLFGFYYRQVGKFDKALERINQSLEKRANFSKAKREKVQIYIGMQDYDEALELARINYENYRDNPYHIEAYFTCVLKSNTYPEKDKILRELIEEMEIIDNSISREMALRFKGEYAAYIDEDYEEAMKNIEQAIQMNGDIQYARMIKFEIAEHFGDLPIMESVVEDFRKSEFKQRFHNNIVCMEAVLKAKKGDVSGAREYFRTNIKNYTAESRQRFENRLNKYDKKG